MLGEEISSIIFKEKEMSRTSLSILSSSFHLAQPRSHSMLAVLDDLWQHFKIGNLLPPAVLPQSHLVI